MKDCFALRFNMQKKEFYCNALERLECLNIATCKFYQSQKQYQKKVELAQNRVFDYGNKEIMKQALEKADKGHY